MDSGRAKDDDVLVLPPLPADPLFVDAVEDAVAGGSDDLPGAQPQRRVGADPRDFASLYMRHRSSFGLHARRFLYDSRDVEEVLQEAFLRLFLAMPELETELQALAYCRRTVTNLCIDRYRADQRRPRLVDLDAIEWDLSDEASYDDPVLRAEDAAIVRQALSLLSPMHRAALVKREIEEKPLPQIAAELGIPEESVKHVLYRARRALRRLLVGTSVEPGADLSNTAILKLANERLARATLRSANVLIVLFVAAVTVVGALRVGLNDQETRGGEVGAVTPQMGGAQTDPAHLLTAPRQRHQSPSRSASGHHPSAPRTSAPAVPAQPVTSVTPTHPETFAHRLPTASHHRAHAPLLPSGPAKGTYVIDAPVLGAVGTAAVRTSTVELQPTGDWSSTSTFSAPTTTGTFTLQQVVQRSTEGVVSANLQATLPVADPTTSQLQSSAVTTTPTDDGNVLVNVKLLVVTPPAVDQTDASVPPLNIVVHAVYTPDVTRVLAEQVTVVEGSAPCCDSPASTTPLNAPVGGQVSTSSPPAALGSTAVSPLSPTRRDDQPTTSSS